MLLRALCTFGKSILFLFSLFLFLQGERCKKKCLFCSSNCKGSKEGDVLLLLLLLPKAKRICMSSAFSNIHSTVQNSECAFAQDKCWTHRGAKLNAGQTPNLQTSKPLLFFSSFHLLYLINKTATTC